MPLLILAGRDRAAGERRGGSRLLRGYKGVDIQIEGRPLIAVLIDRFRATGRFDEIFVAGPAAVYRPLGLDAHLLDADGGFGDNLRAGTEPIVERRAPQELALTTCDILPDPGELAVALEDLAAHRPCDFWMPQYRVDPAQLGSSAYKPRYSMIPPGARRAVPTLPGHLVVANPLALRRELVYRVFDLAYQTRNRSLALRRAVIVRKTLGLLLSTDLRLLLSGRLPTVTWSMLVNGLIVGSKLKSGAVTTGELEERLRKVWVTRRHRRSHPQRRGRVVVLEGSSLARDVDTEEEARELAASVS